MQPLHTLLFGPGLHISLVEVRDGQTLRAAFAEAMEAIPDD